MAGAEVEVQAGPLVRLAEGTALVRRVLAERPALAAQALLGGMDLDEVAEAAGLPRWELQRAVAVWATEALEAGRVTPDHHAQLLDFAVFGDRR